MIAGIYAFAVWIHSASVMFLHLPSAVTAVGGGAGAVPSSAAETLTEHPALVQSPDDVNSYFVFFSSQKDAAAAGQCIVFNEVFRGLQQHRVARLSS